MKHNICNNIVGPSLNFVMSIFVLLIIIILIIIKIDYINFYILNIF